MSDTIFKHLSGSRELCSGDLVLSAESRSFQSLLPDKVVKNFVDLL